MNAGKKTKPENFLECYELTIAPKLKEIDLFLKTSEESLLKMEDVSKLLFISQEEILAIMKKENIEEINKFTFYSIMKNGSSFICQLFKRELERGTPSTYSIDDISYIYNINKNLLAKTCGQIGLTEIKSAVIPLLFANIPATM